MHNEIQYEPIYRLGGRGPVAFLNKSNGKVVVVNKKEYNRPMFIP